ncbi:MAG: mevalonate kinase, partial [Bacteroidota bacterium]
VGLQAELNTLPSDHPIASAVHNLLFALAVSPFPALEISIDSTIPVASGLGSGAAVSVALTRALASFLGRPLNDEQVNAMAYEIEKLHHGTPSGIDNTVITYARPVYFVKDRVIEIFRVGRPVTFVIGDTGVAAPTKESVGDVRRLWQQDSARWEAVFDEIGRIVDAARQRLEKGETGPLGELMDRSHALLQEMTVSSPELDRLVGAAREAGAWGAKLSGGGRGGNMIALVSPDAAARVAASLVSAGAARTITATVG